MTIQSFHTQQKLLDSLNDKWRRNFHFFINWGICDPAGIMHWIYPVFILKA